MQSVEGDRTDRDLDSLRFIVTVHCSFAKDDGFQWPDTSESFFNEISYRVVVLNFCSATMYGLRIFLWSIGLVYYIGHPQPPQSYWARVYCGCQPGPTRVALHPGRMMEKPERQPYTHWTTFYDFEETRNIELCSYSIQRIFRVRHSLKIDGFLTGLPKTHLGANSTNEPNGMIGPKNVFCQNVSRWASSHQLNL